jgi:hypothetical protein
MTDAPYFRREKIQKAEAQPEASEEFPWLVECAVIIPFCAAIPIFVERAIFYDKKCHFTISESLCCTKQSASLVTIFVNFANQGKIRYIGRAVLMSKKINK